jgi:hypothetical protein
MRYAIERQRLENGATRSGAAARRILLERVERPAHSGGGDQGLHWRGAGQHAAEYAAPPPRLLGNVDLAANELTSLIEDLLEVARLQEVRVELWRR